MSWEAGRRALEQARLPDGTWGYQAGEMAFVEPTSLAVLALGDQTATSAGLDTLASWQRPDGAFPAYPGDPDASWTTSFAALALLAGGRAEAGRAAREWLARSRVPREPPDPAARMRVREWMHIDPALEGNAWFGETSAWVEPTAMAGLARLAPPLEEGAAELRQDLRRFLEDRRIASGGWNYGNPYAFGSHLFPLVIPTAKALLALARCGAPRPVESLEVLRDLLTDSPSRVSHAWAALALQAWGEAGADAAVAAATSAPRPDDSIDALALALLVARRQAGQDASGFPMPETGGASDG